MNKYKLILMSFDGDYVTERTRFVETFDTIEDAWDHYDDLGSKWFFYPFPFVVTESGLTISDSADWLQWMNGKRVRTIVNLLDKVHALPETEGMGVEQYMLAVEDYYFSGGKSNGNQ